MADPEAGAENWMALETVGRGWNDDASESYAKRACHALTTNLIAGARTAESKAAALFSEIG